VNWNQELIQQMVEDIEGRWKIVEQSIEDIYQNLNAEIALSIEDLIPKTKGRMTVIWISFTYVPLDLVLSEMLGKSINWQLESLDWELNNSIERFEANLK
jgi:hypothetical protein